MILFISSQGDTLESKPNLRFGRTPFFISYDLTTDQWEDVRNPAVSEPGGAGVAASQFIIDRKANVAISGSFGPNAFRVLHAAGVLMYEILPESETIQHVIDDYKNNLLNQTIQ